MSALTTDLYQLAMIASYMREGMTEPATFSLFIRKLPPNRGFLVAAGLEDALRFLLQLRFTEVELEHLRTIGFDDSTIDALRDLRFTGDVWAVPEGRIVYPDEPLLEITAPLPEAQLVETLLLNTLSYQCALATKAARCAIAAGGRASLVDFGMRRAQGIEAAMAAARAAAIAGFVATSNVESARQLGIPASGTMAHSYVESFPDEKSAFTAFAKDFPDRTTFLVDTYDTLVGVRTAMEVARECGIPGTFGVRLDSGDLLKLSIQARRLLDQAGYPESKIVASGSLDELEVKRLLDAGAPIDVFGVGTKVATSADAPFVDSAYKLVEYGGRPVMKLSAGKETRPGPKQVYRFGAGDPDLLATRAEPQPEGCRPLLVPVMSAGKRLAPPEDWTVARVRLGSDLAELPSPARDLVSPVVPHLRISAELEALTSDVRAVM